MHAMKVDNEHKEDAMYIPTSPLPPQTPTPPHLPTLANPHRRIWNYIRYQWMGVGTARMGPEILDGMVDEESFKELKQWFRELEEVYLKEAKVTACRRAFRTQCNSWMPWLETDGRDRMRS